VPNYEMNFPLHGPTHIKTDPQFEKKTGRIILYPFPLRLKIFIRKMISVFHLDWVVPKKKK